MSKSPYIKNNLRLEDVIAAIQVLGAYEKKTSRRLSLWINLLSKDLTYWLKIFKEHPEFFRVKEIGKERLTNNNADDIDDESIPDIKKNDYYVSLRWRFAYPKNYDPTQKKELTSGEIKLLGEKKNRLTHKPLSDTQIQALIETAINLHEKANEIDNQKKWWKPLLSGLFVIIGALVGLLSSIIVGNRTEELWLKEKIYLQYDKTIEKRIEIYENTVSIFNKQSDATLSWDIYNLIVKLDSSEIDALKQNMSFSSTKENPFNLDEKNIEQLKLRRNINELTREYAVNVSLANSFFGASTRNAIKNLKYPWWENDSLSFVKVLEAMDKELFEYELNLEN